MESNKVKGKSVHENHENHEKTLVIKLYSVGLNTLTITEMKSLKKSVPESARRKAIKSKENLSTKITKITKKTLVIKLYSVGLNTFR
jgi:hypothetical protein